MVVIVLVCICVHVLVGIAFFLLFFFYVFAFGPSWPRQKAIRRACWQAGQRSDHPGSLVS